MISMATLAEYFENELNALITSGENYEFKIWAETGHYKMPYRQGNTVYYFINAQLATSASAVTPNALVMGVNGLTLSLLVPTLPPKTNADQTDEELDEIQDGQLYMIQQVGNILLRYFTKTKTLSMTDDQGNNFSVAMYSGVAISGVIGFHPKAGEAMPMSVSITMNFAQDGVNGQAVKIYMDGELVPYMSLNPSRSSQLSTDVQSNTQAQKHIATSTAYGIQFTCPSATGNAATIAVYDYITETEPNSAHFIEVVWGDQRDDTYLMLFTSANATVAGAEFAGLNATMGEAYETVEYFKFPSEFEVGTFSAENSSASSVSFTLSASFTKTFSSAADAPSTYPFYYYIAGKAYKLTATRTSQSSTSATYSITSTVTVTLEPDDYAYSALNDNYSIYLVASAAVAVSGVSTGFSYSEVN